MLDFQTLLFALIVALFVMVWYSTNSKRNKIICYYMGKNKTLQEKWVSIRSGYVAFERKKFDIISKRMVSFWYNRGIHALIPTKVECLFYSWYSRFPHDPDNYENVWETPEVRDTLNKEEWVRSYYKGASPSTSKKQSLIQQYIPYIALLLVVLIGLYVYNHNQQITMQMNTLQNAINALR